MIILLVPWLCLTSQRLSDKAFPPCLFHQSKWPSEGQSSDSQAHMQVADASRAWWSNSNRHVICIVGCAGGGRPGSSILLPPMFWQLVTNPPNPSPQKQTSEEPIFSIKIMLYATLKMIGHFSDRYKFLIFLFFKFALLKRDVWDLLFSKMNDNLACIRLYSWSDYALTRSILLWHTGWIFV